MRAPTKVVVDASVAVKWYLPEPGSKAASAVLDSGDTLLAPDLLVAEFGNVIWKKVRNGELASREGDEIIEAFLASAVGLRPASLMLQAAFDIAIRYGITVYDALYLVVALAEPCTMVTADAKLGQSLANTPLAGAIQVLAV